MPGVHFVNVKLDQPVGPLLDRLLRYARNLTGVQVVHDQCIQLGANLLIIAFEEQQGVEKFLHAKHEFGILEDGEFIPISLEPLSYNKTIKISKKASSESGASPKLNTEQPAPAPAKADTGFTGYHVDHVDHVRHMDPVSSKKEILHEDKDEPDCHDNKYRTEHETEKKESKVQEREEPVHFNNGVHDNKHEQEVRNTSALSELNISDAVNEKADKHKVETSPHSAEAAHRCPQAAPRQKVSATKEPAPAPKIVIQKKPKENPSAIQVRYVGPLTSELLQQYFSNTDVSGGGVMTEHDLNTNRKWGMVSFKDTEAVQRVVERHEAMQEVNGVDMYVSVLPPLSQHTALFNGVPEVAHRRFLQTYFEDQLETGAVADVRFDSSHNALVTFSSTMNWQQLQDRCNKKPLANSKLLIEPVYECDASQVFNISIGAPRTGDLTAEQLRSAVEDHLKRKGWPECKVRYIIPYEKQHTALIIYNDHKAAAFMGRSLDIDGKIIRLTPYFDCMGLQPNA